MTPRTRAFSTLFLVLALALAACGGDGGEGAVSVTGTDSLAFEPDELRAAAEEVTVELTCEEGINHNFVIEELDDELVVECDAGATESGSVELESGTYTFYCNIAGHREAGMEGSLTVEG